MLLTKASARTAKSCGPDIPTLISSPRVDDLAGDGDKKPGLRGEHEGNRKTIVREMPGLFRCTCGDFACVLLLPAREAAGALVRPAFPAPSLKEGRRFAEPGPRNRAAGRRRCASSRGATRRSDPEMPELNERSGLLRGACHRARVRATRWLAMTDAGYLTSEPDQRPDFSNGMLFGSRGGGICRK